MKTAVLRAGLVVVLASCGGAAGLPVDRSDARFHGCGGDSGRVIAAFPMVEARDYHEHLPHMGESPELDGETSPAFVVVFDGMIETGLGAPPADGATTPPRSQAPGTHDLCVWVGDVTSGHLTIYGDVDVQGLTP